MTPKFAVYFWLSVLVVPPIRTRTFVVNGRSSSKSDSSAPLTGQQQWNQRILNTTSLANDTRVDFLEEAFEEQDYYLQRLFLQYGENGTLSFGGLQKLLDSLGLGEVNVLEVNHQGLRYSPPTSIRSHSPHLNLAASSSLDPHTDSSPIVRREEAEAGSRNPFHMGGSLDSGSEGMDHSGEPSELHLDPAPGQGEFKNPSLVSDHPFQNHLHGNCLNVTQLLWNFGLGKTSHITPSHFTYLCPALLYQIDSGVCLRHTEGGELQKQRGVAFLIALGWGSLALTVISLPSLLALGAVPLMPPASLRSLLCPMAALAVGTLCGDALLHLLPHAIPGSHATSEQHDAVLKGLSVLAGLYLLFLVESLMGLQRHHKMIRKKERSGSHQGSEPERERTALQGLPPPDETQPPECFKGAESGHGHSHGPPGQAGMRGLVWMVVMGDGIHNLTDGLAIGAAFSQSFTGGLSTTVAVFCHELPHELGDLAVLLGAGWPVRRLLLFSGFSAALGFVGLLAGTILGRHSAQLSPWILALTAGVFLHVALADMMPEMLHGDPGLMRPLTRFLLQNLGLLLGGAIMLCIALFEDDIALSLGDG